MFYTATGKSDLNIKREEIVKNSENTMFYNLVLRNQSYLVSHTTVQISPSFIIRVGTITLRKPFVFEVANAELIGPAAVGFDQDGSLISETVPTIKNLENTYLHEP